MDILEIGYDEILDKELGLKDDELTYVVTLLISVGPHAVFWAFAVWAASNCKSILKHHGFVDMEVEIKESMLGQVTDPYREAVGSQQSVAPDGLWIDNEMDPSCEHVAGDGRLTHLEAMMSDVLGSSLTPSTGTHGHGSKTLYLRVGKDGQEFHAALTSRRVVMGPEDFCAEYRSPIEEVATSRREVCVSQMGVEHVQNAREVFQYWSRLIQNLEKELANPRSPGILEGSGGLQHVIASYKGATEDTSDLFDRLEEHRERIHRCIGRVVFAAKMDASKGWMRDYALIKLDSSQHAEPKANRALVKPLEVLQVLRTHALQSTISFSSFVGGEVASITLKNPLAEKEIVKISNVDASKNTPDRGLLVSTYGAESGAALGIVNGVKSITRRYLAGHTAQSWEVCVIGIQRSGHDLGRSFSKPGDAGACVWTLDGKIVGMVTGGAMGAGNRRDGFVTTYVTPMDSILGDLKEAGFDVSLDLPLRTKSKWTSKGSVTLHWDGKEYVERQEDKSGDGEKGQLAPLASK